MSTEGMPAPAGASAARHGATWFAFNMGVSKALAFGAQVVLGWLLAPQHFGLFAIASALFVVAKGLQDAGVHNLLVSRGLAEYGKEIHDLFWLALVTTSLVGGLLAVGSIPMAAAYDEPKLGPMLWVMAASLPLGSYWSVASARLELELRFKEYALCYTVRSVIQFGGVVLFAYLGLEEMAFVLPFPLMTLQLSVMGWLLTKQGIGWGWPSLRNMRRFVGSTVWLMGGTVAAGLAAQGDYLASGLTASTSTVGLYYFAYQVPAQGLQMSGNMVNMLFPFLARIEDDPERTHRVVGETVSVVAFAGFMIYGSLALVLGDLETLLWRGRWADAVLAGRILCAGMPFLFLMAVPRAVLLKGASFKGYFSANVLLGLGLLAAGLVGGLADMPEVIAAYVSGALCLVFFVVSWRSLGGVIGVHDIVRAVGLSAGVAVTALGAGVGVMVWTTVGSGWLAMRPLLGAGVYVVVYSLGYWMLDRSTFRRGLSVVPVLGRRLRV